MGLSMEEQRILSEIEHELARTEPGLHAKLSRLGSAGHVAVLGSRRTRALRACGAVIMLAIMSLLIYSLISLSARRGHGDSPVPSPRGQASSLTANLSGH